jgi:hypothetical protein
MHMEKLWGCRFADPAAPFTAVTRSGSRSAATCSVSTSGTHGRTFRAVVLRMLPGSPLYGCDAIGLALSRKLFGSALNQYSTQNLLNPIPWDPICREDERGRDIRILLSSTPSML